MRLIVIQSDDWVGVYVNSQLYFQGHSFDNDQWINLLKEQPWVESSELVWLNDKGVEWLVQQRFLPLIIWDIPREFQE